MGLGHKALRCFHNLNWFTVIKFVANADANFAIFKRLNEKTLD